MPRSHITCNHTNTQVQYRVENTFNAQFVLDMHDKWNAEKNRILAEMVTKHPECMKDINVFASLLTAYNIEDLQWDWLNKAVHCNTDEYRWFYLIIEEKVQATCIIYHPKKSQFDTENIFYVDYLATAFWNRSRPDYKRQYAGLATILLAHGIRYAIDQLKYRPGFCLHSLPKAESYYVGLGMTDFGPDKEKQDLKFFEAESKASLSLMEQHYA